MNETKPTKNKKETTQPTEKKKRSVNWLGERLVEKIDRDHYMCIICFKRMSRGYACSHCLEEHQNITDEMKPMLLKAYINGKKVNDELIDLKIEQAEKQKNKEKNKIKAEGEQPNENENENENQPPPPQENEIAKGEPKSLKKLAKLNPELKKRLEKLEFDGKQQWEMKPKKELEKERTIEGKRVTGEISKIMAQNGIPFAKSDAIWKIVKEVINSTSELGPPVLEKIRFSARTLKRRYDEVYAASGKPPPSLTSSSAPSTGTPGRKGRPASNSTGAGRRSQTNAYPNTHPRNTHNVMLNPMIPTDRPMPPTDLPSQTINPNFNPH